MAARHAVERGARGLDDVALPARRAVGPVHAVVGAQVGPAVAAAEIAARGAAEARGGEERGGRLLVAGDQRAAHAAAAVVAAVIGQRRVGQHEQLQALAGARDEAHVDDERVALRVGDVGLDDPVAARRARLAERERARVGQRDRGGRRSGARAPQSGGRRRRRTGGRAAPGWRCPGSRPRSARRRRACARPCSACPSRCRSRPCRPRSTASLPARRERPRRPRRPVARARRAQEPAPPSRWSAYPFLAPGNERAHRDKPPQMAGTMVQSWATELRWALPCAVWQTDGWGGLD